VFGQEGESRRGGAKGGVVGETVVNDAPKVLLTMMVRMKILLSCVDA